MQVKVKKKLLGIVLAAFASWQALASDPLPRADSLRLAYRFLEAADSALAALEKGADTLAVQNLRILAENGSKMMNYVCETEVVGRKTVLLDDFILYCPFEDKVWKQTPNELDSLGGPLARAIYAPRGREYMVFSAVDSTGVRSLYSTYSIDGAYSSPEPVFGELTASSNEIYPVLSSDGTRLYFASDGLYGAGGYDLYVSRWDTFSRTWGTPENLGFPYSSPANDILYMDSDDGKFTAFVSDRNTEGNFVDIFVVKREEMPVRRRVDNPDEMLAMARLEPAPEPEVKEDHKEEMMPENDETLLYVNKMEEVRSLRDSINNVTKSLEQAQSDFAAGSDEHAQALLLESIRESESRLVSLRALHDKSVRELQNIELDFLFKGVSLDPEKLMSKADRGEAQLKLQYEFPLKKFGD